MRSTLCFCALTFILAGMLPAATMVATSPLDLSAMPGASIQWTVDVSNDANYLVPTSFNYATFSPVGTFTDIFAFTFLVIGPNGVAPLIGPYDVDITATPGFVSTGQLVLTYDLYGVDPNDPSFNPDTDTISNGNMLALDASVTVQDTGEIPEPATVGLMALGVLGLGFLHRRR